MESGTPGTHILVLRGAFRSSPWGVLLQALKPERGGSWNLPSLTQSRIFRPVSLFTASVMHRILELELLSETRRHFHKIFASHNLSIWSLSEDPRILEPQNHLWTHRPESLKLRNL